MQQILVLMRTRIKRAIERDKKLARPIEKFSRLKWPWQESKLILLVALLAVADYASTFMALRFGANHQVSELGLLANWALTSGGFAQLLIVDAAAIGAFILLAIGVRALYNRFGFPGVRPQRLYLYLCALYRDYRTRNHQQHLSDFSITNKFKTIN